VHVLPAADAIRGREGDQGAAIASQAPLSSPRRRPTVDLRGEEVWKGAAACSSRGAARWRRSEGAPEGGPRAREASAAR
jgi:hypothetical protein